MNTSQNTCISPLRKRSEFVAMRSGKRQHSASFVLQSLMHTQAEIPSAPKISSIRVGYTVTKKVGNAVVRNRVKRRLRAAAQIAMPIDGLIGHDYVLIGKHAALHSKFETLVSELHSSLNRVHRNSQTTPIRPGKKPGKQAGIQHGQ